MFKEKFSRYLKKMESNLLAIFDALNAYEKGSTDDGLQNLPVDELLVQEKKKIDKAPLDPYARESIDNFIKALIRIFDQIRPGIDRMFEATYSARSDFEEALKTAEPDRMIFKYRKHDNEFYFMQYIATSHRGFAPIEILQSRFGENIDALVRKCQDAFGKVLWITMNGTHVQMDHTWCDEMVFLAEGKNTTMPFMNEERVEHVVLKYALQCAMSVDTTKKQKLFDKAMKLICDVNLYEVLKPSIAGALLHHDIISVRDFISMNYNEIRNLLGFKRAEYNFYLLQCYAKSHYSLDDLDIKVIDYFYFIDVDGNYDELQIKNAIDAIKANKRNVWKSLYSEKGPIIFKERLKNVDLMYKIVAYIRWFTQYNEKTKSFHYVTPKEKIKYDDFLHADEIKYRDLKSRTNIDNAEIVPTEKIEIPQTVVANKGENNDTK